MGGRLAGWLISGDDLFFPIVALFDETTSRTVLLCLVCMSMARWRVMAGNERTSTGTKAFLPFRLFFFTFIFYFLHLIFIYIIFIFVPAFLPCSTPTFHTSTHPLSVHIFYLPACLDACLSTHLPHRLLDSPTSPVCYPPSAIRRRPPLVIC